MPLDITDDSYNLVRNAIGGIDEWGRRQRPSLSFAFEWAPNTSSSYYLDIFYTGYRHKRNAARLHFGTDSQPLLSPYEYYEGTNVVSRAHFADPHIMTSSNALRDETDSYQYALGGDWQLTGALDMSSEVTYQLSKYQSVWQVLDVTHRVDEIIVDFNDGGSGRAGVELIGGELTSAADTVAGYYLDGRHRAQGEAANLRVDFDYYQSLGFVESWQFGGRYDVRNATADNVQTTNCFACEEIRVADIDGLMTLTPGDFFAGEANYPTQWATTSIEVTRCWSTGQLHLYRRTY